MTGSVCQNFSATVAARLGGTGLAEAVREGKREKLKTKREMKTFFIGM